MAIDFTWVYLIFFLIPLLVRIVPRFLRQQKMKNHNSDQTFQRQQFEPSPDGITRKPSSLSEYQKDKLVLRELNKGPKTFEKIQKNTSFERNELNSILEDLEKRGLMGVKQKNGLFGPKVELYVTEKGFKEYHS